MLEGGGGGDFKPYNLPQTVRKSLIVGEVDELVSGDGWLEATYLKLVRSIEHRLTAVNVCVAGCGVCVGGGTRSAGP